MAAMGGLEPIAVSMLLGMAVPAVRRSRWLPQLLAGAILAVASNLPLATHVLGPATAERLLGRLLTPVVSLAGNTAALLLVAWGLWSLLRGSNPDRAMARRLARRGDPGGAADLYLRAGDLKQALRLYERAHAWPEAARVALRLGNKARAAELFKKAGHQHLEEAARLFSSQGLQDEARQCYHALARWFTERNRYNDAVGAWMRAGEPERAARAARLALTRGRINPSTGEFKAARRAAESTRDHELTARLLETEGDYLGAAEAWMRAGKPEAAAEAWVRMGKLEEAAEALDRAGRKREAAQLLLRAERQLATSLIQATAVSGSAQKRDLEKIAARLLPRLEELGMDQERVEVLLHVDRVDEAVTLLLAKDQVARAAEVASAAQRWELAAALLERLGRWGEASDAHELAGQFADAARCAEASGEGERALDLYRRVGDPRGVARALVQLGRLPEALVELHGAGLDAEAWELLKEQPGPVPDIPGVILEMAEALRREDRLPEAIACLQRAVVGVAPAPSRLPAAVALSRMLLEAGDLEAARTQVQKVLEFDYSNAEARRLHEEIERAAGARRPSETLPAPPARTPAATSGEGERYEILSELGRGGMGVVFKARDTRLERIVAIKVVRTTSAAEASHLEEEAKAAATLNHPAIVTVYDFGPGLGGYLISMEYVDGRPLDAVIRENPERIQQNLLPLLVQIADAVAYAHEHRVIHRDIKPGNILLTPAGRVKIFDFGIAARLGTDRATGGKICGTPFYMSPEQIRGEAPSPASDIYSLGATFFHLATGRPPFNRGNVIEAHLRKDPPDPLEVTEGLQREVGDIILRCLEKDPARRYASAADLHAALIHVAVGA